VIGAGCPAGAPWWHNGVDFACSGCLAYAVSDLTIVFAGSVGDCAGTFVRGRDARGFRYDYYHLAGVRVQAGDAAGSGQPVGDVGTSGCSTGDHLHLSVWAPDGREINPFNVLQQ
jgi:murein DD-endopeptidase MepM/ murein hydrolase activator NlpD